MRAFAHNDPSVFDLYVRGSVPKVLEGSLIVATNRRNKDRSVFSRWHDSQADLFRIDLTPGRPGRIRARLLTPDPNGKDIGIRNPFGYVTQPNHGINIAGDRVWATNLFLARPSKSTSIDGSRAAFCATSRRTPTAPRSDGTAHFAWSLDHRYAYFHQSLLRRSRTNERFARSNCVSSKWIRRRKANAFGSSSRRRTTLPPRRRIFTRPSISKSMAGAMWAASNRRKA